MAPEYRQPRKRKRRSRLFGPVAFLITCTAVVLSMSIFFRVSTIEIVGESRYSDEEILVAAGIEKGSNLFFTNRFSAVTRIYSQLPYIESASISRHPPGRIVIELAESKPLAYVRLENDYWIVDRSCKLLQKATAAEAAQYIHVRELTPIAPLVGATIAPGEAEMPKVTYLSELLHGLDAWELADEVSEIDMGNVANPTFRYQGRFTVKMGGFENVSYKLELLQSAVSQLAAGDAGVLDLSTDKRVSFSPD